METKPRILYLQKILLERTDEENPLSTTQLINILNDEYGISAHRTTVTKDIAALQEFGMDIVTIHSTQSKYFVASRKFELPELKLLIDAVESSKFITKKKSETLIEKIHTMTSPGQVAKLKRNNYVVNRIKPDNEQIYYIIDAINDAINAGKQISFQYYDYTGLKKKVLKNKGEVYKLSPYKLLWCGDYYYVLGYSEKKSKVINFRVDRIASKPEILDKDIIPMPDDFDIENYTKEVFFMFSGEKVLVDLRCDNSLMRTMVDRFGEDVTTLAYDMTSFRVQTEVSASPTFFGWVFGFNGKVQILAPERKIGKCLYDIEKKVNLNNAINDNLASMAYDIYMHTFFSKKPNGKLKDILIEADKSSVQVGEAKQSTGEYPFFTSGSAILKWDIPFINGRNCFLNTGGNADVKFYVGEAAYSTDTWCISTNNNMSDYLYLLLVSIKPELNQKFFQGTGLKHLQKPLLKDRPIYIPDFEKLKTFNEQVNPMFNIISENTRENQALITLRDWLLPMLMNGQATISD